MDVISNMLKESNDRIHVEIRNFGRFSLRIKNERLGRNPATGDKVEIPMKKKVHFKASTILLKRLNEN